MFIIPYFDYFTNQIYYQINDNETNQAIIFIHGSGGNSRMWQKQFNMDIEYKIIAMDLPSHANSDDMSPLNLDIYTNVVNELIDKLKLEKVILVGHSLGGAIIQNLYLKSPDKIAGLILIGTGGRLRVSPIILKTVKNEYPKYLQTLFTGAFSRKTDKEIINEAKKEASKVRAEVTYQDFFICDKFDILDKIQRIDVPCLIIVGSNDNLTPIKYSEYFHKNIKQSELHIVQDAGHMVMIEKPEEVNKEIKNFITKLFNSY